ncbi:MAG: hypothetical protein WBM07_13745 [Chitinivibrionales bacterium]
MKANRLVHFPLPGILQGLLTPAAYDDWVRVKAWALYKRDKKRGLPAALNVSIGLYKETVNGAVAASGPLDPYTGVALAWDLIGAWDPEKAKTDCGYVKQFYLMPTVDHIDPRADTLAFEICSWEVNCCKSFLNPAEFLDMCGKVMERRGKATSPRAPLLGKEKGRLDIRESMTPESRQAAGGLKIDSFPAQYLLPPFLEDVCTLAQYSKWLLTRAKELYKRDKKMGRACAMQSSRSLYRRAIHAAACASGPLDPYTGDALTWNLIGKWDAAKGNDDHDIFRKEFTLLPTVDHIDPEMKDLDFEICSWLINCCKSGRTPEEFIGLCGKVMEYAKR